jgi:ABC-type arginine transport system permease subunit
MATLSKLQVTDMVSQYEFIYYLAFSLVYLCLTHVSPAVLDNNINALSKEKEELNSFFAYNYLKFNPS